jgi:alanyl-tRNA synthetase
VDLDNANIKDLAFQLKGQFPNLFLVLANESDGKAGLSVMVADELVKSKNLHAGTIVKELAREINGGGGGQPFFATAGGTNVAGIEQALRKAETLIS